MSTVARRYYVSGLEALQGGRLDAAHESLRAALDLAPTFVEARIAYAGLLARTGEHARGALLLREALGSTTRLSVRLSLERALGDVLLSSGDYRGAEASYAQASELGRSLGIEDAALHDRLARLRARTGRFAESLDELLAAARAASAARR